MSLTLSRSEFEVRFLSPMRMDDFPGAGWRSGIGTVLRQQWCSHPQSKTCDNCTCPYSYTWNPTQGCNAAIHLTDVATPAAAGAPVPPPYILNAVDSVTQSRSSGEATRVQLTLMGHIRQEWPEWLLAFNALGERGIGESYHAGMGRFELERVWDADGVTPLTARSGSEIIALPRCIGLDDFAQRHEELLAQGAAYQLTLMFGRPLRLDKNEGKKAFSFLDFWNALVTRIKNLMCYCENIRLRETFDAQSEEFKMLALLAGEIKIVDQALNHREQWRLQRGTGKKNQQKRNESGWVGHVTLQSKEGNLANFLYYLAMGEWVHVGYSCNMGNGAYCILPGRM